MAQRRDAVGFHPTAGTGFYVSGRSKPASDGRLKTSHYEETRVRQLHLTVIPASRRSVMANHLTMALFDTIRTLHTRGWSQRCIVHELGIHRETAARYLQPVETWPQRSWRPRLRSMRCSPIPQ